MCGSEGPLAEHAAPEVGPGVPEEGADEDVDDDALAMREVAQKDGMGQGEPDPVDPEQRDRDRSYARPRLKQGQAEQHRQRRHRD